MNWYEKYTGFGYKHLGTEPEQGIDCFNLCNYVYKKELNIDIPYLSSNFCNIVDDDWYNKTNDNMFLDAANNIDNGWVKVATPKVYDIIIMSLGSTNTANHCAMYVDRSKMLQTMIGHKSWISLYGNYYKQYTLGIYRWKTLQS